MVTAGAIVLALLATAGTVFALRRRTQARTGQVPRFFPPAVEQAASRAAASFRSLLQGGPASPGPRPSPASIVFELAILAAWALWIGRSFLDFNPHVWPAGREFGLQIYGLHFWDLVRQCGACALWNGMINGGTPFLGDPFGGFLHPVAGVATLLLGAVNGAKVISLASLWMAGMATLWIARTLGAGGLVRTWAGMTAASSGYIVARLELGAVPLVLSTASASLALAAALDLAVRPRRSASLVFAALLAMAFLSGHGYMQLALLFWAPALALIVYGLRHHARQAAGEFALAVGMAVLLASVFLVPFLELWPHLAKDADAAFAVGQPLEYIPFNLVIHDWQFYITPTLGTAGFPYLYSLFVGWPAVILAILCLALARREDRWTLLALLAGILTMFWLGSGEPLSLLARLVPALAGFRNSPLMAGLAVPALLGLSAYGLDRVVKLPWAYILLGAGRDEVRRSVSLPASWLLALPLAIALRDADRLARSFLAMLDRRPAYSALAEFQTDAARWSALPWGEHYWVEPGLSLGFKLTNVAAPWWYREAERPMPEWQATRDPSSPDALRVGSLNDIPVYQFQGRGYAYVADGLRKTPCRARALGGDLRISCTISTGGDLMVAETWSPGWTVTLDGIPAAVIQGRSLSTVALPGEHEYRFRYRPPSATFGMALTGLGIALLAWLGWKSMNEKKHTIPPAVPSKAT